MRRRADSKTNVLFSSTAVVEAGTSRYYACQAVDISALGARIRTKARLRPGTAVRLELIPPEGPSIRVGALVWRVDADGLAFLFGRGIQHRFIRAASVPARLRLSR